MKSKLQAIIAISLFVLGTFISTRSTMGGWSAFLFIPFYLIGLSVTYFASTKVLESDFYSDKTLKMLCYGGAYFVFAFLVVGDNGDNSANYWQGNGYESVQDLPKIVRMFQEISTLAFLVVGIVYMFYAITLPRSQN